MKKALSLILTLALVVGVIAGISAPAYATVTIGGISIIPDSGQKTVEKDVANTYERAMKSLNENHTLTKNFEDPREAWDYFITHKENTNWFRKDTTINSLDYDLPDYYCYAPSKYGIDPDFDGFGIVGHTELFDLCRASFPGHYSDGTCGVWKWVADGWQTTVYYDAIEAASEFGHPNALCNQDNPVAWNQSGKTTYGETSEYGEAMYTGDYSAEMQAKIQTWWDTLDAYIATQNGTAAPTPVETQAPATPTPEQSTTIADSTSNPAPSVDKDYATFTVNGREIYASDWAVKDVTAAVEVGIATVGDTMLDLPANMTIDTDRGPFFGFIGGLFRALGKGNVIENAVNWDDNPFVDLINYGPENPHGADVNALYHLGIVNGVYDDNYGYMVNYWSRLTREQAATIIQRAATVLGIELPDGDIPFTDSISDWALDGVRHCYAAGIMNGYDDTTFGAKDNYTYEQALITVYRLYQYAVANA